MSLRTLAVDWGKRRIGLAISDESGKYVSPLAVIEATSPQQGQQQITKIAREQGAVRLVVGLPLNMDGTAGESARHAVRWGTELGRQCELPVIFVDERLSSFVAEQELVEQKRQGRKITRQQKKERLDALAAADFLRAFLEGRLAPLSLHDF